MQRNWSFRQSLKNIYFQELNLVFTVFTIEHRHVKEG